MNNIMDKLNNEVKKLILIWIQDNPYNVEPIITDIKSCYLDNNEGILVFIETHRPGLIIGKHGTNINKLKEILERNLETKITISLKESELWNVDYNTHLKQ